MDIKQQKVYAVMTVVLGLICCFYAQAGSKSTEAKKFPLSSTKQFSDQSKNSLSKVSTASTRPTSVKKPLLMPVKEFDEQASKKRKLEDLKKSLKKPGQKFGLETLLSHVKEQAEHCSIINPAVVKWMFSSGTELHCIECAGEKYFVDKEEFLAIGAKQANKQGKDRIADILNIHRWQLKQGEAEDIDELLKIQRLSRGRFFYLALAKECQIVNSPKQLKRTDDGNDDRSIAMIQKLRSVDEGLQQKFSEHDKQFNPAELYSTALNIAQDDNVKNQALVVYFAQKLEPIQCSDQKKNEQKSNFDQKKSGKKPSGWW